MPCLPIDLGNGATAIVCTRGPRRSCKCGRRCARLCDFELLEKTMPTEPMTDIIGRRFGRLIAIQIVGQTASRHSIWECECDCGESTLVKRPNLISGATRSCGCLADESRRQSSVTHGGSGSAEYRIWAGIIKRCENPNAESWSRYGGSGVRIAPEWRHDFGAFLAHVGPRPSPQHSIDRFPNGSGNYEPGNVRWATPLEQSRNRVCLTRYTFRGVTGVVSELAEAFGKAPKVVHERLRSGWSLELALTVEPRKAGKTCDAPLCDRCATSVGPERDYCPAHIEVSKREAAEDDARARDLADERDEIAARESFRAASDGAGV